MLALLAALSLILALFKVTVPFNLVRLMKIEPRGVVEVDGRAGSASG